MYFVGLIQGVFVLAAWTVFQVVLAVSKGKLDLLRFDMFVGASIVATLTIVMGTGLFLNGVVTIGKEGLRNGFFVNPLLRWEKLRRLRSPWFMFVHVASAGFFGPKVAVLKPWFMGDPKPLYRAIEDYAPQDSPLRRLLPTGEQTDS